MTTIAQQAQELANMARSLHRKPISKTTVADAIAASKPIAVANTRPELNAPHGGDCDCASCVRHKDANFNEEKMAEAKQKGAVKSGDVEHLELPIL